MRALCGQAYAARRRFSSNESMAVSFGFYHPEFTDVGAEVIQQSFAPQTLPVAATCCSIKPAQMLHMSTHAFGRDAMNIDQIVIVAIDEVALDDQAHRQTRR